MASFICDFAQDRLGLYASVRDRGEPGPGEGMARTNRLRTLLAGAGLGGFLVFGALSAVAGVAVAQEDLSREEALERLEQAKQKLEASRTAQESFTRHAEALAAERARLNSELIESGKKVQASESELLGIEARLAELTDQVDVIRNSINDRKRTIAKMLSGMQRMGRQPPPAFATQRDDVLEVVRSAKLLSIVFPELKYQADNLSRELEGLVRLEDGIREERDAQKRETEELIAQRNRLDELLDEKRENLAQNQAELQAAQAVAEQQAAHVVSLNELIAHLDEIIAKAEVAQYDAEVAVEAALRHREQRYALAIPPHESIIEIKPEASKVAFLSPDRMKPAVPFDRAKNSLPLPAKGEWIKRFGDADGLAGTAKGVSIRTRPEARIVAPSDGWVVYAGEFRSYGQLLIINAGGGYHVLLAGMSRIDVNLGQFVLAGEPVAAMADPAASSEGGGHDTSRPVLYVEFRKDGQQIDPDPWWAESSEKVQG
jgi:murein hydrolase activator